MGKRCNGQKAKGSACNLVFKYNPKLKEHVLSEHFSDNHKHSILQGAKMHLKANLRSKICPRELRTFQATLWST